MNDFICSDTVQPRGHCGGLDDVPIRLVQVDESSRLVVRLLAEAHYHEADLLLAHAALLGNDCLQLSNPMLSLPRQPPNQTTIPPQSANAARLTAFATALCDS